MIPNLFSAELPTFTFNYTVEVVEDPLAITQLKYYVGKSAFGKYVVVLYNDLILELSFTDNEELFTGEIERSYPAATLKFMKSWELSKFIFNESKYLDMPVIGIALHGTPFQLNIWNELLKIPFGQTVSYDDIATTLGDKNASRAVGTAVGQNSIAFVVPCHRVIAKNGKLSNFRWGIEIKKQLLQWEFQVYSSNILRR